ncbi:MAG TPA: ribosome biogenesis GTPase YlqF [Erysipelotrichaceae bacterium]|nr:ribosome biogenesis GTPase YlqF [Erysipelotrichaceae bacterium]
MGIQWFPGHMTKAKREMQEKLKMVDMVIECRDARIPMASINPLIFELAKDKPRLIVLSKLDMADQKATQDWMKALSSESIAVIALDLLNDDTRKKVVEACLSVMKPKFDRWKARGIGARKIKAMVVGIPNVGKSTLINQLAKKKVMTTADRPGVTMALKWANVHPQLDLLDTPGVLWPKFDDPQTGINLALAGSISEKVLPIDELAYIAFNFVLAHYPNYLNERYGYTGNVPSEFFEHLAKLRLYIKKDEMMVDQAYVTFLREVKQGTLGPMSFEYVENLA